MDEERGQPTFSVSASAATFHEAQKSLGDARGVAVATPSLMVSRKAGEARKHDIGAAAGATSRVWFTLAQGRLDDVFYPQPDTACVRALRLFVDGAPDDEHEHACARPHERVPLVEIETRGAPYSMAKETIADPRSSAVLQRVRWQAPRGRLRVQLEPELAVVEAGPLDHHAHEVIAADFGRFAVALAASVPWVSRDGLVGELDGGDVTLALGFGSDRHIAAHIACGAVLRGFDAIREDYISDWHAWHDRLGRPPAGPLWVRSACVLKSLGSKHVDGGRVAALAKPWGPSRNARASGSYHLVWTRDLVETTGGLIAAGAAAEARQALAYLAVTQRSDGHWPQNMRLDGRRVWKGNELDETALPILLVDLVRRERLLEGRDLDRALPMIARAAARLAVAGPSTRLDRWEDAHGVTPFTIAAEIAALRVASSLADSDATVHRLAACADRWDESIEPLLYRRGGPLADRLGIAGYYVRARVPGEPLPAITAGKLSQSELSPDALALARFGVRAAEDPRLVDTVRAIDAVLRTEVGWRRYPADTYGEHADGSPWNDDGIGRSWPLLVGERAHYELARGNARGAHALREQLERLASTTGMLPEQTWDAPDIRERGLVFGSATHSASPLGWAHAEYVKLCRSLADGKVFDLPTPYAGRR